jgi:hypothetical protein
MGCVSTIHTAWGKNTIRFKVTSSVTIITLEIFSWQFLIHVLFTAGLFSSGLIFLLHPITILLLSLLLLVGCREEWHRCDGQSFTTGVNLMCRSYGRTNGAQELLTAHGEPLFQHWHK